MSKTYVLLLIIVSLLATSFAGICLPRARAATQPQVVLTTSGAGLMSGYTVTFTTGPAGDLTGNQGKVSIIFPTGTLLPATISPSSVHLNGLTPPAVQVVGQRVDVTVPVGVGVNAQVQVMFDVAAGIRNPSTPQSVALQVYTTSENSSVSSAMYQIVAVAHVTATVNPVNPDGLNGYYKTHPVVSIAIIGGSSAGLSVFYRINGGAETPYVSPIQVPDGNITVVYYARDILGNQENPNTLSFKVKTTLPQITILSPTEGSSGRVQNVTLTGRTEAGAILTVAGAAVPVSAQGEFQTQVTLKGGQQSIMLTAIDMAGNVGQAQLKVTLDTTPPALTITKPIMYSIVLTNVCEVSGKTEPGATVSVAGTAVSVNADGTFSLNVMLKEGENLIEITATDAVGNQHKTAIPVTYKARTVIRLQVGNKTAMVNNVRKTLEAAPVNVKGVVMVPLRFIGEAFGALVTWDPVFQIIDIELRGLPIRLQLGANYASVAGKKVILQGVPVIISGTTMVPIRFISEAFGAQVVWNAPTQGIDITYPKP